jgi:hypothetical protein
LIYERVGRVCLVLALSLAFSVKAEARRTKNFDQADLNLTFGLGAESAAKTSLIENASNGNSYSTSMMVGIGWDLGPFGIRVHGRIPRHSVAEYSGSNSIGAYRDTSTVSGYAYGGSLVLFPFDINSTVARLFFRGSVEQMSLTTRNERIFSSGTSYSEKATGSTTALALSFGAEFFLLQNYVMGLEGGYRRASIDQWKNKNSGTNLEGAASTEGSPLLDKNGNNRSWSSNGLFIQGTMGLHF